ncbi:MAG TPA: hypothetical protein VE959_04515 [Bryobacteraceae bacterium]|nr:hypothetical protein [Bryobacteraceae bacterium]
MQVIINMDELHREAEDIARRFLAFENVPIDERSDLFADLQRLAIAALETARSEELTSRSSRLKESGEVLAYWPIMRPAA